jgi:hypothetical protein
VYNIDTICKVRYKNYILEVVVMAQTAKGNKWKRIAAYTKKNGQHVSTHCRSTPRTSKGKSK